MVAAVPSSLFHAMGMEMDSFRRVHGGRRDWRFRGVVPAGATGTDVMDAKKQAKQEKKRKREELTLFGLEMENIKQAETKRRCWRVGNVGRDKKVREWRNVFQG